ncbi:MAG: GNAT family protein [Pseudomonadota bacterium]
MSPIAKPVIRCEPVTLRPLGVADAAAIWDSLDEPEANRLTGTQSAFTFDAVRRHCKQLETADDRVDYGIVVAHTLVGEVVLNQIDWINRCASFRIALWRPEHRNRGYGSIATFLAVRHGFEALSLNRIELEVYAFNPRARRVYEKMGFVLEGTRRQALLWDGDWVDAHMMSLLRDHFDSRSIMPATPHDAGQRPDS